MGRSEVKSANNNNSRCTALCPGLPGWAGTRKRTFTHPPGHHPDHHPIFISFFHLLRSIASSLFKLHAWQSFCTTSLHVLFGLPRSGALHLIFHTFLHPISVFSSQQMPIPSQPVLL